MTLLFGQFPQSAFVAGQFVLHALVGSVGDEVTPPAPARRGGGWSSTPYQPAYIRRDKIEKQPPVNDEDVVCALAILLTLETHSSP